jgi:hypothetical protein
MQQLGGYVYLLHYRDKIGDPGNPRAQAQHYVGWCYNLSSRMQAHMRGRGAALTRAFFERGITFELAATWPGSRRYERAMKRRKMGWRMCPVCRAARRQPAGQLMMNLNDDLL